MEKRIFLQDMILPGIHIRPAADKGGEIHHDRVNMVARANQAKSPKEVIVWAFKESFGNLWLLHGALRTTTDHVVEFNDCREKRRSHAARKAWLCTKEQVERIADTLRDNARSHERAVSVAREQLEKTIQQALRTTKGERRRARLNSKKLKDKEQKLNDISNFLEGFNGYYDHLLRTPLTSLRGFLEMIVKMTSISTETKQAVFYSSLRSIFEMQRQITKFSFVSLCSPQEDERGVADLVPPSTHESEASRLPLSVILSSLERAAISSLPQRGFCGDEPLFLTKTGSKIYAKKLNEISSAELFEDSRMNSYTDQQKKARILRHSLAAGLDEVFSNAIKFEQQTGVAAEVDLEVRTSEGEGGELRLQGMPLHHFLLGCIDPKLLRVKKEQEFFRKLRQNATQEGIGGTLQLRISNLLEREYHCDAEVTEKQLLHPLQPLYSYSTNQASYLGLGVGLSMTRAIMGTLKGGSLSRFHYGEGGLNPEDKKSLAFAALTMAVDFGDYNK
ncbi:MAG: hypothetical protein WCP97_03765 [bacterium]